MVYTPGNSLDRTLLFKSGMIVIIDKVTPGRDKTGQYMDCHATEGRTYRTYSKYLMEDLKTLTEKGFDFAEGFATLIQGHIAESGNAYFTFETPSEEDLATVLKAHPLGSKQTKIS